MFKCTTERGSPLMEPALQKTKKLFIKPEIAIVNLRPWQPANAMHTQEATKGVGRNVARICYTKNKILSSSSTRI